MKHNKDLIKYQKRYKITLTVINTKYMSRVNGNRYKTKIKINRKYLN